MEELDELLETQLDEPSILAGQEGAKVKRREFIKSASASLIALRAGSFVSNERLGPPSTLSLVRSVDHLKSEYQACQYELAETRAILVLTQLEERESIENSNQASLLAVLRSHTYYVVASLMLKASQHTEALSVANRAFTEASNSGDPLAIGAAARIVVHATLAAGSPDEAASQAVKSAERVARDVGRPSADSISIQGALLLRGAMAASYASNVELARDLLDEAQSAAESLGSDANYQWTAFGPSNVQAHRAAVELAMGNAGLAVAHFNSFRIGALPIPERRAVAQIDLASAFTQWGKYDEAIDALWSARTHSDEEVRRPKATKALHTIDRMGSTRVRQRVRELERQLATT